ncbi:NUDIX domain-containing protein [Streptococcus gallolyticus]|nr:NUDIX domain-containing protein [Streptococcus gallolyticus]MBY5040068.1 NUDIX domain-containing protein [Streptococcus gallolyticus]
MAQDYISYIRSKVGHDKIILNFAGGILANDEGKVLLQLREDKKTWSIPGGTMELGESSLDTCKREFFEETGVAVEAVQLLNVYTNFEEAYPNGDAVQTVVFIYELKALSDIAIENFKNEKTLKLQFFSREEIEQLDSVSAKHQLMLEEYFTDSFTMGH